MSKRSEQGLSLGGNMLWNSAGSFFYFACQYLPTILVVRMAADLNAPGVFNYAMNTTNAFLTIAVYGMRAYQVSDLEGRYSDREYVSSRLFTCLLALAACAAYGGVLRLPGQTLAALLLYMLFRVGEALVDVYSGIDQRADRMDVIGKSFILRGALSCLGFALGMKFTGSLLLSVGLMAAVSLGVALAYDRPWAARLGDTAGRAAAGRVRALLVECAPLMAYSFLNTAVSTIPRQFLQLQHGNAATAIFGSITAPTVVLQLGATYVFTPLISLFTRRWLARDRRGFGALFGRVLLAIGGIGIAGFAGVKLLGRWGLALLYSTSENGRQILANEGLLTPMVAATVLTALVLFLNMLLTIVRDFKGLVISNLIGIAACLGVSPLLVGRWDMWGASWALIAALSVQAAALLAFGLARARRQFAAPGPEKP